MFQFSSLLQHLLLIYLQYNLSKTTVKLCFTVDLSYGISRLLKQCYKLIAYSLVKPRAHNNGIFVIQDITALELRLQTATCN